MNKSAQETAVIMMTDIIGYTRLTRQEESLVRAISVKHKNILQKSVSLNKGRIIHIVGDKSLSVFSDSAGAVNCALEIQRLLKVKPLIPMRIALHYGEIIQDGEEIYGEAINLTSRILEIAVSNCILISESVRLLLDAGSNIQTRSIGIHDLKYVDHPIEIFGICNDDLVLPEVQPKEQSKSIAPSVGTGKGERLLAAIMFTDMVGYTSLMQEDEHKAKQNRDRHRKTLQKSIAAHQGKVLQYYGDGTLAIFNSSIEAVDCAIEIQQELQTEPKIPLRIGIHTGDIVYDDEGIYGDGVNVASRIEGLAVSGSVLVSGKVFDDLKNHHEISTAALGAFVLKNVKKPLEIYAISNNNLIVPSANEVKSRHGEKEKSLAILPFANFSSDPENECFSDGISEAIINTLTQIEGLFVTARTSSFAFKGQNKDIREIGKVLGVVYILEGSVQRHKNRIRVTAQLIDTINGFHIFSETYDRELMDVFSIQDEISWLIAEKLREKIKMEDKHLVSSPKTNNVGALDYYIKGRNNLVTGAHPNVLKALKLFQQSIDSDPEFVLPYTGISKCYTFLGAWGFMEKKLADDKSNEYVLKALEKGPNHPAALVAHIFSSFWGSSWDFKVFESSIHRALKIAPGSSEVRLLHGILDLAKGNKDDSLIELLLAKKLDPINPNIDSRLGFTYHCLKEFKKARDCYKQAHRSAQIDMYYHFILAWSYLVENRYEQAEIELGKVDEEKDGYQLKHGTAGFLHARLGRPDLANEQIRLIKQLEEQGKCNFPNFNCSLVYAGLNQADKMYHHLEKAYTEKPLALMFIRADPFWEPYRADKRFMDLVDLIFNRPPDTEINTSRSDLNL